MIEGIRQRILARLRKAVFDAWDIEARMPPLVDSSVSDDYWRVSSGVDNVAQCCKEKLKNKCIYRIPGGKQCVYYCIFQIRLLSPSAGWCVESSLNSFVESLWIPSLNPLLNPFIEPLWIPSLNLFIESIHCIHYCIPSFNSFECLHRNHSLSPFHWIAAKTTKRAAEGSWSWV